MSDSTPCPICKGTGVVVLKTTKDYTVWITETYREEFCHRCGGKGIIKGKAAGNG